MAFGRKISRRPKTFVPAFGVMSMVRVTDQCFVAEWVGLIGRVERCTDTEVTIYAHEIARSITVATDSAEKFQP